MTNILMHTCINVYIYIYTVFMKRLVSKKDYCLSFQKKINKKNVCYQVFIVLVSCHCLSYNGLNKKQLSFLNQTLHSVDIIKDVY